jgi:hypothetical protein
MPPVSFLIFELGIYALALISLVHAARQGRYLVMGIVAAAVFSFVGESLVIRVTQEYYYSRFLIMLCRSAGGWRITPACQPPNYCVPLVIPIMEAIIIYAAMTTSDRLRPPWPARSLLDGLLALCIDLGIDPIVSIGVQCDVPSQPGAATNGLGFWIWALNSTEEHLLGVDLNNYAGWFLGVAVFSFALRLSRGWFQPSSRSLLGDVAAAALALLLAMLVFAGVVVIYHWIRTHMPEWIPFTMIVGASFLTVLRFGRSVQRDNPIDGVLLAVPLCFYLFSFGALLLADMYLQRPLLIPLWLTMFALGALAFTWPYWGRLFRPGRRKVPPDVNGENDEYHFSYDR